MQRPVFFNLTQIRMPVGALTSIVHRITGVVLAAGIPLFIRVLELSLQSPQSYARVAMLFDRAACKLAALVFAWALAHHLMAGVRHLLSDVDIGSRLPVARRSAWVVNLGALAVALFAAWGLF